MAKTFLLITGCTFPLWLLWLCLDPENVLPIAGLLFTGFFFVVALVLQQTEPRKPPTVGIVTCGLCKARYYYGYKHSCKICKGIPSVYEQK